MGGMTEGNEARETNEDAEWEALMEQLEADGLMGKERPPAPSSEAIPPPWEDDEGGAVTTMDDFLSRMVNGLLKKINHGAGRGGAPSPASCDGLEDGEGSSVADPVSSVSGDSDSDDGGWFTSDAEDSDFDPLEYEGREHYVSLGLHRAGGELSKDPQRASAAEIRAAWHRRCRKYHPGSRGGGRLRAFSRALRAYEVLRCPVRKAAYDDWADDARFDTRGEAERRVENALTYADSAEFREQQCRFLLEQLEDAGAVPEADPCDPDSCKVLILLCGLCGRPSNLECWTCRLPLCDFCKSRPHWNEQHGVSLHYPLVATHINAVQAEKRAQADVLAKEARAEENEIDLALGHEVIRSDFLVAARRHARGFARTREALSAEALRLQWTAGMARYYRWGQDEDWVYVCVYNPLGGHARVAVDARRLQVLGGDVGGNDPAVVDRYIDGDVARGMPIEQLTPQDGRYVLIALPKAYPGTVWDALFQGDPPGTSAVGPILGPPAPYEVVYGRRESLVRVTLGAEVKEDDVDVDISARGMRVWIAGRPDLCFERAFTWPQVDLESSWHACFNVGSHEAELEIVVRNGEPEVGGTVGQRKPKCTILFKEDVDDFHLTEMLLGCAFALSDGRALPRSSLPPNSASLADTLQQVRVHPVS